MSSPTTVTKYCPRCDKPFSAKTETAALLLVKAHVLRNLDDLHDGAIEEFE